MSKARKWYTRWLIAAWVFTFAEFASIFTDYDSATLYFMIASLCCLAIGGIGAYYFATKGNNND